MHHEDGVNECGKGVQHVCRLTHIQWLAQFFNGVEELEVISGFVGCISNATV